MDLLKKIAAILLYFGGCTAAIVGGFAGEQPPFVIVGIAFAICGVIGIIDHATASVKGSASTDSRSIVISGVFHGFSTKGGIAAGIIGILGIVAAGAVAAL